jgi:hypothetical protein
MTSDFSDFDGQIQAAKAELSEVITQAQEDLARFRRENKPTDEERQALQDAALRGELGEEMRELARRVSTGRDTWEAVFSGDSPSSALLQGHLDRMAEQNRTVISTAIEQDPDFDPFPPDDALN